MCSVFTLDDVKVRGLARGEDLVLSTVEMVCVKAKRP